MMSKIHSNTVLGVAAGCLFFFGIMAVTAVTTVEPSDKKIALVGENDYVGEVLLFGGNFCPRGYLPCDGQLLSISSNTALFSLLGTTFGGDGKTNFALPDLRGRTPMGIGSGTGLPAIQHGENKGTEMVPTGQPGKNVPNNPTLGMTYCICTQGIYPSRN